MACSRVLLQFTVDVGRLCLVRSCRECKVPHGAFLFTCCSELNAMISQPLHVICICTDTVMYTSQVYAACIQASAEWLQVATVVAKHSLDNPKGYHLNLLWLPPWLHGSYSGYSEHVCPMPHLWNMEAVHVCTQHWLQAWQALRCNPLAQPKIVTI